MLEVFVWQLLLVGIVSPLTSVLTELSQHSADTCNLIFFIQPLALPIVHLSASDSFTTMALYKFTYLLTDLNLTFKLYW